MYGPNERIDYIVLPIPSDLGRDSKLRKVISVSDNIHRLLKRNKLITVGDLLDIDYEEIATFRANDTQKTLIHGAKQELEEYLSDKLFEKEHDFPVSKPSDTFVPDEAVAEINRILKEDYEERLHAYKREDIWRNRYQRMERDVSRMLDRGDRRSWFFAGLYILKDGFEMANVCPPDKLVCTRSWLANVLKVLLDNPLYDSRSYDFQIEGDRNRIVQ